MQNVVLVIHLILALALIGIVLIQRSEGGGLGIGGGGGVMTGRQAATALSKVTWALAVGFIATSISLTVIAARNTATDSVIDRLGNTQVPATAPATPAPAPEGGNLLPPAPTDGPVVPPKAD